MSRLTLPQINFVIEFIMKHDSSKYCRIQFDKTFGKTFFLEQKETARQLVSHFVLVMFVVMLGATS